MNPQTYTAPQEQQEAPASFAAILPLLLFLLIFIGTGVSLSLAGVDMAFYQLSATVAILPAIALALMQGRARLSKKITIFLTGIRFCLFRFIVCRLLCFLCIVSILFLFCHIRRFRRCHWFRSQRFLRRLRCCFRRCFRCWRCLRRRIAF